MDCSTIAIYYCHSPITYSISLARSRKYKQTEIPFFISARSFQPPDSRLHIEFDNLVGYQETLQFSKNWNDFIHGIVGDESRIVLHVPHLAILPIRLMLSDTRISGYSFIEEGSLCYVDNLAERSHGDHDYVAWFGMDELLINELCVNFSSDRDQLISALTGQWMPFNWRFDKMLGATVVIENSLSDFARNKGFSCELLPLEKIDYDGLHDSAVILLPPLSTGWVNSDFLSFIIEYVFSCPGVEKVFMKLHPENASLDYEFPDRFGGRLFFYDFLPDVIVVDRYVKYLEPATLSFRQLGDSYLKVNNLQAELNNVYQSGSWLVTKPLRGGCLRLKKFLFWLVSFSSK